jgi:hypothetical protein
VLKSGLLVGDETRGVGEDADIGAPPAQAESVSADRMATA